MFLFLLSYTISECIVQNICDVGALPVLYIKHKNTTNSNNINSFFNADCESIICSQIYWLNINKSNVSLCDCQFLACVSTWVFWCYQFQTSGLRKALIIFFLNYIYYGLAGILSFHKNSYLQYRAPIVHIIQHLTVWTNKYLLIIWKSYFIEIWQNDLNNLVSFSIV